MTKTDIIMGILSQREIPAAELHQERKQRALLKEIQLNGGYLNIDGEWVTVVKQKEPKQFFAE